MAEIEFTPEQRAAIERRDGGVFLRAGAGTGKTAVLVERFVQAVLQDGVKVEQLLAITFTDKAAAELGARVRARFVELGERDHARAAEGAWISTFHGLCSRILRAHSLVAEIDPEYRVLDEAEARRLAADAFDLALGDFLADPAQDRLDLAAGYTPAKLEQMVRTVHARLRSSGQRAPELPDIERPPDRPDESALKHAATVALAELGSHPDELKSIEKALTCLEGCRDALAVLADGRTPALDDFENLAVKPGNTNALKVESVEAYNAALSDWCAGLRAATGFTEYQLLRELLRRYGEAYERLKRQRSGLDFDDLELLVHDLLKSDEGLRDHYRDRFAGVMVDEFQDVNPLQAKVLALLARPERLFTVGDERQSIYLFRHADVGLFTARADEAEAAGELLRLTVNFRSRPAVLEVLNRCWAEAFLEGVFDRLEPGREDEAGGDPGPRVELLVTDASKARWDEHFGGSHDAADDADDHDGDQEAPAPPFGERLAGVPPWRAAEARLLALRVRRLIDDDGFEPGEIAVLVRATTDMSAFEGALEDLGVPTYLVGGRGYWRQQQVLDLRAYLAALANPLDGQALLAVLASPLAGLSLDGLALVGRRAKASGRGIWRTLHDAFGEQGDDPATNGDGDAGTNGEWVAALGDDDRRRLAEFVERFAHERRTAPRLSLERLIDRAITSSGYDTAILATAGGDRRMANVRKLMRLSREFEADEGRDLRGFIDYLDLQGDFEAREGEAPLEAEAIGAVRLMTIHAAKGLEFPVVCLADLGRSGKGDDREPLQVSEDGRVGLSLQSLGGAGGDALDLEAIKQRQRERHDAEERRIFYVAMTRAQERLIVSGAADLEKLPEAKPLGVPMDWGWRALARQLEGEDGAGSERDGVGLTICSPATVDEVLPQPHRDPTADSPAPSPEQEELAPEPGRPPDFSAVETPEPLTVTRLSYSSLGNYDRCGYRFYLERALRLPDTDEALGADADASEDDQLTALVRGQIVHELLERVDFGRPAPPGRELIAAQVRAAGVTPAAADVDDLEGLMEAFLASSLSERLAACGDVLAELPFAFTLEPDSAPGRSLLVTGVVDVRARDDETTLVADYKSDRLRDASPADLVERKYATQRRIYALAALRSGAGRVEVVYCFLERPDELVSEVYTDADAGRLERELVELAAGVIAGRFPVSEHPNRDLCSGCPGEGGLCSWPLERTRAERDAA